MSSVDRSGWRRPSSIDLSTNLEGNIDYKLPAVTGWRKGAEVLPA